MPEKKIRVLIAKPGLDGHDRGAKVIARALRDAGMEVIYTGLRQTPEMIASAAATGRRRRDRNLHPVRRAQYPLPTTDGICSAPKGMQDVIVLIGGIIPEADIPGLKQAGIAEVFLPGTPMQAIVDFIRGRFAAAQNA